MPPLPSRRFAIGLSYATENRRIVKKIYDALLLSFDYPPERVFVDWEYGAEIQGSQTASKLVKIYREQCELIVPIVSRHYVQKLWTNHEWRAVQEVLFQRYEDDVVIPIYLEGATLDGWPSTGSPIHKKRMNGEQLAEKIHLHHGARYRNSGVPVVELKELPENSAQKRAHQTDQADDLAAANTTPSVDHGYIIVADVLHSSDLPGQKLRDVILSLREVVGCGVRELCGNAGIVAGQQDGLIIVAKNTNPKKVFEQCQIWIETLKQKHNVSLRLAISRGDYHHLTDPDLILGKRPNECVRLARLAGAQQIILAESFVRHWREQHGDDELPSMTPPGDCAPWDMVQKPGAISRIRIVHEAGGNVEPPRELREASEANLAIRQTIEELTREFDEQLTDSAEFLGLEPLKAATIKTRTSLFLPNPTLPRLDPTGHRYLRYAEPRREILETPGEIVYAMSGRGTGPVGEAYRTKDVCVLHRLPDPRKHPEDYRAHLQSRPWSLDDDQFKAMRRKARAFVTVPFSLTDKVGRPEGVVCIDTKYPLEQFDVDDLKEIGEFLRFQFGIQLAALWRLRR